MKCYAQLNENNVCVGVSQLNDEIIQNNMIEIPSADVSYIWKKYENGEWSTEKFEPKSTAPLDQFTSMKQQIDALTVAMANMMGV